MDWYMQAKYLSPMLGSPKKFWIFSPKLQILFTAKNKTQIPMAWSLHTWKILIDLFNSVILYLIYVDGENLKRSLQIKYSHKKSFIYQQSKCACSKSSCVKHYNKHSHNLMFDFIKPYLAVKRGRHHVH